MSESLMEPTLVTAMPYTLLKTQTEGEKRLREEVAALSGKVEYLRNALVGVVVLLEEHGIQVKAEEETTP